MKDPDLKCFKIGSGVYTGVVIKLTSQKYIFTKAFFFDKESQEIVCEFPKVYTKGRKAFICDNEGRLDAFYIEKPNTIELRIKDPHNAVKAVSVNRPIDGGDKYIQLGRA